MLGGPPFESFEGFLTFGSPASVDLRGRKIISPVVLRLRFFNRVAFFKGGLGIKPASSRVPNLGHSKIAFTFQKSGSFRENVFLSDLYNSSLTHHIIIASKELKKIYKLGI